MKSLLFILFSMQSFLLPGQGKISGLVIEKDSRIPIEFAGIEILGEENGKLITGTINPPQFFFGVDSTNDKITQRNHY